MGGLGRAAGRTRRLGSLASPPALAHRSRASSRIFCLRDRAVAAPRRHSAVPLIRSERRPAAAEGMVGRRSIARRVVECEKGTHCVRCTPALVDVSRSRIARNPSGVRGVPRPACSRHIHELEPMPGVRAATRKGRRMIGRKPLADACTSPARSARLITPQPKRHHSINPARWSPASSRHRRARGAFIQPIISPIATARTTTRAM